MDVAGDPNARVVDRRGRLSVLVLLGALLVASAFCAALVEVRNRHEHDTVYRSLVWNLFLAWVPALLSVGVYRASRAGLRPVTVALGIGWLLFFPNAPYILTDFIHLEDSRSAPLWYDGLMLSAFAWTGLLLGFFSLYLMQLVWRRAGGTAVSWAGVVCVLALGSLGVYIGRFIGFNSWDALLHPLRVAHVVHTRLENPLRHPRMAGSLVALTGFLTMAYAVFYAFAGLRMRLEGARG